MKTIWKHELAMQARQYIQLPVFAKALCVQMQHDKPMLWALVNSELELRLYCIEIVGTGHEVLANMIYQGTFQVQGGDYIFHVFSEPSLPRIN